MAVCRCTSSQRKSQVFPSRKSRSVGGQSDFGNGQIVGFGHALAVADTVKPNKTAESQNNQKNEETKPFQDLEQHRTPPMVVDLGRCCLRTEQFQREAEKHAKPKNTQSRDIVEKKAFGVAWYGKARPDGACGTQPDGGCCDLRSSYATM